MPTPSTNYLRYLYGDQLSLFTESDSQAALERYKEDARKRLDHDTNFPNEPRQLQPGENIKIVEGKTVVGGRGAVMAINEMLLRKIMEKNPELKFAMEESFPFRSLFAEARPMGPILELGAGSADKKIDSATARQSVAYWQEVSQSIAADPLASDNPYVRLAYAKLAASQGGLLLVHGLREEAEVTFRTAVEIAPASPEAVFRYVNLLVEQKKLALAVQVTGRAQAAAPGNVEFRKLSEQIAQIKR